MQLEEQMKFQENQVAALKEELSRLNAELEGAFKDAGLTPDQLDVDETDLPPEAKRKWDELRKAALRAGEARKAHAVETTAPGNPSGAGRRGAVRV